MVQTIIKMIFEFAGSLAILLFAMNMLSSGIQKGSGDKLQPLLQKISSNRILATLTGLFVTAIIQSSGATTVMVVSFVNAGLMTLTQSIGIIFGANIGTTVTAWIVSIFGFSFKISALAIPIFGLGFYMYNLKKWKYHDSGEILMGFGLLFLGLSMLTSILDLSPDTVSIIQKLDLLGIWGNLIGLLISVILTALIHSSSAVTAIVLTLAYNNAITWELSAILILGSNIGSTVDAVLAGMNGTVNAKRTALVHVLFNVTGTVLALIFLKPLLYFVDFIVPGEPHENITTHIAMLHTVFNLVSTLIFLPFVNQLAKLVTLIIPNKPVKDNNFEKYDITPLHPTQNATIGILQAQNEINIMTQITSAMLQKCVEGIRKNGKGLVPVYFDYNKKAEAYLDEMNDAICTYLVQLSHKDSAGTNEREKIDSLIQLTNLVEALSDQATSIMHTLNKNIEKKFEFSEDEDEKLIEYANEVLYFLDLAEAKVQKGFTEGQMEVIMELKEDLHKTRKRLKKNVTSTIEEGGNVSAELAYLDLVKQFETAAHTISRIIKV